MASAPQQDLPLLYNDLIPLSSQVHGDWRLNQVGGATFLRGVHAVPLLAEEFIQAQRHYPVVFSVGANPVPLALMGLNENVNVFVNEEGFFADGVYVPAYIRRYPFMLARLRPDADELSLCFDPTSPVVSAEGDGEAIFADGQPSERTREILNFCESFEQSSQATSAFVRDLVEHKLLIDGEFTVDTGNPTGPHVYRGFQIIAEEAVRNMRGDVARKLIQSGAMALIFAQLFSLQKMGDVFAKQADQGMVPGLNGVLA